MPQIRLTKRNIDRIERPKSGQVLYYDTDLRGLGLRVGVSSATYFAERQVRRRTRRVTIGPAHLLTPDTARRKALGILAEMADGHDPNEAKRIAQASSLTVDEAFDRFFEGRTTLTAKSRLHYGRSRSVYLKDWGIRRLNEITPDMILARHRRISECNGKVTANNVMRHLRSVYNYVSATVGELPANPVAVLSRARLWHKEQRRRTLIPMHGVKAWFDAVEAETDDARDFLKLALFTGMRRSEIAGLRWEHIDLAAETLTVPVTKNGEPLDLPLSWYLTDLLIARRQRLPDAEWVFPGRGATGHIQEVKTFSARVTRASGVPFTIHDLRRTFVTIAESLDIPAYALKRLLNHRTDRDVTGGYIIIDTDRLRGPVNRIADRILELAQ